MYGAILGDIVGSPYEFDCNNYKGKDFPLFSQRSEFTDDTVMTLAVARALLDTRGQDDITIKAALVREMQPFGFLDYNKLQKNAYCVLSDSGTLSEESAMLGFAGVLIRTSTERPEVLDKGSVVIGGIKGDDVEQAMELAVAMRDNAEPVVMAADYADTNVSVKVVKLIQSYAKIVNETVWLKR